MSLSHTGAPGIGIPFDTLDAVVWNRTGGTLAIGEIVQFDHKAGETETAANGGWPANVVVPKAGTSATIPGVGGQVDKDNEAQPAAWFAVVIDLMSDAGADNKRVRVRLKGPAMINPVSGDTFATGLYVFPTASVKTGTVVLSKQVKAIANVLNGAAQDVAAECIVDGIHGFGTAGQDDVD